MLIIVKAARPVIYALGCALVLLAPTTLPARDSGSLSPIYDNTEQRPPNIVLILFDWARRDGIGVYSAKDVSTPNIDALANEGVRFDNAYTPATLCSPARASIITGVYPHAHQIRKTMYPAGINGGLPTMYPDPIANPFDDERFHLAINFPKYVTNSGFATAHIGKWHLGTGNPGFFDLFKSYNSLMPHWIGQPHQSAYREDIQTSEGIRFIRQNADRPFFLYQSYYTPHAPFQPPQKYVDLYQDRDIDHKNYYAAMSSLDHNVGRIVKSLQEQKILQDTLIIISADHAGSFQERPGSYRGMGIAYDEAARIPMIMHWPKGLPSGVIWDSGVSLVDLAPTMLAAANINTKSRIMEIITGRIGSPFHGRDLIAEVTSGNDDWRVPVFMQNIPEAAIENSWFDERAMRFRQWKLVLRAFDADPRARNNAFFDLARDPGETDNLYYQADFQVQLEAQLELMLKHAEDLQDSLSIRLATRELDLVRHPEKVQKKLY
ncbi:MAG: sulfatase-like hydrolase/transferase [Gammaproteobacteria bacterium]|nr:sulfatase-like hydrolase/transferase [Gammaproteobacteria bacterium]